MTKQTAFEEFKKAQEIISGAIEKSTRANLASVEKLLEINKQSLGQIQSVGSPADFFASQTTAFKQYAEQVNQQFEQLSAIGAESREQLTGLSQEFAKNMDFGSMFNFGQAAAPTKTKSTTKAA